jgi:hypothetical protein
MHKDSLFRIGEWAVGLTMFAACWCTWFQISTLASVYHKPADSFVSRQRLAVTKADDLSARKFEEDGEGEHWEGARPCRIWVLSHKGGRTIPDYTWAPFRM